MRLKIINIIFLLLLITILYIFSDTYFSFFLFLFSLMFIFLSILTVLLVKNKLKITIRTNDAVPKGEEMPIVLYIKNRSLLPIARAKCNMLIHNCLTDEKKNEEIAVSIQSKGEEQIQLNFLNDYSGKINLEIVSITYYDILGIFSIKQEINDLSSFYVLPNSYYTNVNVLDISSEDYDNLERFTNKSGIGNEYFNLKEYVPGDNIKQIHWKLSSKLNEIILKENSETVSDSFLILLETTFLKEKRRIVPRIIDAMLEAYISITKSLINQEKIVSIGWQANNQDKLRIVNVDSVDHLQNLLPTLLQMKFHKGEESVLEQFVTSNNDEYSHIIYIFSNEQTRRQTELYTSTNLFIVKVVDEKEKELEFDALQNDGIVFTPQYIKSDIQELSV